MRDSDVFSVQRYVFRRKKLPVDPVKQTLSHVKLMRKQKKMIRILPGGVRLGDMNLILKVQRHKRHFKADLSSAGRAALKTH